MEEKDASAEIEGMPDKSAALSNEGEPSEEIVSESASEETDSESEGPQWATTVIALEPLNDPEFEEDDIMAIIHRLPGVDKVWMDADAVVFVHDPDLVTRAHVIRALAKWGFYAEKGA